MMSIKRYELKKVFTSPVVLVLMGLFIVYNLFIIYDHAYMKEELSVVNQLADKFGYQIDDEMMDNLPEYYQSQLKKMNEITNDKISKTYEHASAFFGDHSFNKEKAFTKEELDFMTKVAVVEGYYNSIQGIDSYYENLNVMDTAESQIKMYGISGEAADTVRKQFSKLGDRLDQLIENGEHKTLFFNGKIYGMHSLLFKNLFRTVIFEVMILVVLMTGFLLTYEFENKTHLTAYSSKKERRLDIDKFLASLFASSIVTTVILGITLGVYFMVFNYSGLWHVPISSFFNTELKFPYISWWKMSFITYLISSVVLLYVYQILFSLMTFIISTFIRNSYIVFLVFGIFFGMGILMPGVIPNNTNAIFVTQMTPFSLILNPHLWFMGWSPFTVKYYELYTVVIWAILLLILCGFTVHSFKKKNID